MTTSIVYGVGAIDAIPALVGRDLGSVLGLDSPLDYVTYERLPKLKFRPQN